MQLSSSTCLAQVILTEADSLHLRPAASLARIANQFDAEIFVECGALRADCKRILDLLVLGIKTGARLTVRAIGRDARDAVEAIKDAFCYFRHAEAPEEVVEEPPQPQAPLKQSCRWRLYTRAKTVCIAGDFSNWSPLPMAKVEDGFQIDVELPAGEYQYKFIVDGLWRNDPTSREATPNVFGTKNNVIRVSCPRACSL